MSDNNTNTGTNTTSPASTTTANTAATVATPAATPAPAQGQPIYFVNQNGQPLYIQGQPGSINQSMVVSPVPYPQTSNGSQSMVYYQVPQGPAVQYYTPVYPNPNVTPGSPTPVNPPPSYEQSFVNTPNIPKTNPKYRTEEVVIMVNQNDLPRHSAKLKCPHCNKTVDTVVQYEDNALVWALCVILFIFTFLCCIPFCIKDLKDAVHYCPICKHEIGRKDRL